MVQEELICGDTKIFYSFLPMSNSAWDVIKILEDRKSLYVRCTKSSKDSVQKFWKLNTDGLFYNSPQSDIYNSVTDGGGILECIAKGGNGIILCYGQTYSGKTVTTSGLNNNFEDRGLILRLIEEVFRIKERDVAETKISLDLKYVEANTHYIRNLLDDSSELFDMNTVDNLRSTKTSDCSEAMQLIFKGETRKTLRNRDSYLSNMANCILTLIISSKSKTTSFTTVGTLHVVDLSGIDTEGNFSCFHKKGQEVGTGNLAKTQLDQLLSALRRKDSIGALMKQRMNIVLYYLRESLNNRSILRFIGHIRATNEDARVSLSLLKFGQLVKDLIPDKVVLKAGRDPEADVKILTNELLMLKKEKDLDSMLHNEDLVANLCQDRYDFVKKLADDYLHNRCSEIVILSTADAVLAMKVFKDIHEKTVAERNALLDLSKQMEEAQTANKMREGSLNSKASKKNNNTKYSANSITSGSKTLKRSPSKKNSKTLRESRTKEESSIKDTDTIPRISRQSSKLTRRRSGKRKSCDSSIGLKSEVSINFPGGISVLPDSFPSHAEAWGMFVEEAGTGYGLMKEELDGVDQSLRDVYEVYMSEVENLKEINKLVITRKEELHKAVLLKDLDQTDEIVRTELELTCTDNLKLAETRSVQQKEVVLKIQSELKLVIDCRNKIKADIERNYEDFCKRKFGVAIPDITTASLTNIHLTDSVSFEMSGPNLNLQEKAIAKECEPRPDPKVVEYNKLRKYMKKEYLRRLKEVKMNKKWIKYCMNPLK